MNLDELNQSRIAAGARYRAATDELHVSLIELAALDGAVANKTGRVDIPGFFNLPQNLGSLAHPEFAPADTVGCWRDQIVARLNELLAQFEG